MSIIPLNDLSDITALQEGAEVEYKLAGGRDGHGSVPNDMWESYSAFANTRGGVILLGIKEKKGQFTIEGIKNPTPLIKNIWDVVNNPQKTNYNLLSEDDVCIETIGDKQIIRVIVPRAPRELRPIYINNNPLTGTYVRRYETDQKCLPDVVNSMLAERESIRDNRILTNFTMEDINQESLRIYRQLFTDAKPHHPFLEQDDINFLRSIRAWGKDRINKTEGLTLAGLVMFGTWEAIQDALPNYALDYQEKDDSSHRWVDRIYSDGSWSGNAFDFYRKVYRKLTIDLKVGFTLKNGQRVESTPAHEAIREALVNTIAHADFTSEGTILVEKHPDFIGFRNPGLMRISVKEAISGGNSLCRNPAIHQMFLNIGLSEKAGSGIPKIYSNCRAQNWQPPHLYEKDELNQTLLELRMVNIVSEELNQKLITIFGTGYKDLSELKRTILITAITESWFNHERVCALTSEHTRDVTLALSQLVANGYLESAGQHKGKIYHLKGVEIPTPENDTGKGITFVTSPDLSQLSLFDDLNLGSEHPDLMPEHPDLMSEHPDLTINQADLTQTNTDLWQELFDIAKPIRNGETRPSSADLEKVLIQLLEKTGEKYLKLPQLSELLGRNTDTLRKSYLSRMLKEQKIELAYPTKPNHPEQGYTLKRNAT